MSDSKLVYDRVVARFTELVDSITAEQWLLSTPCAGWTVRDLMQHIIGRDRSIASSLGGGPPTRPAPDEDLAAAWHERVAWWAVGLADPGRSQTVWVTAVGELTFHDAVMVMMIGELTVHTWDLARALGADESLDPEAVRIRLAELQAMGDRMRGPTAFGPEIPVPADADEQTRLLALAGRSV